MSRKEKDYEVIILILCIFMVMGFIYIIILTKDIESMQDELSNDFKLITYHETPMHDFGDGMVCEDNGLSLSEMNQHVSEDNVYVHALGTRATMESCSRWVYKKQVSAKDITQKDVDRYCKLNGEVEEWDRWHGRK